MRDYEGEPCYSSTFAFWIISEYSLRETDLSQEKIAHNSKLLWYSTDITNTTMYVWSDAADSVALKSGSQFSSRSKQCTYEHCHFYHFFSKSNGVLSYLEAALIPHEAY